MIATACSLPRCSSCTSRVHGGRDREGGGVGGGSQMADGLRASSPTLRSRCRRLGARLLGACLLGRGQPLCFTSVQAVGGCTRSLGDSGGGLVGIVMREGVVVRLVDAVGDLHAVLSLVPHLLALPILAPVDRNDLAMNAAAASRDSRHALERPPLDEPLAARWLRVARPLR